MSTITDFATGQLKEAKIFGIGLGVVLGVVIVVFYVAGSIQQSTFYKLSIEKLEKEIAAISQRNKRVERDKLWETSATRRIMVAVFTIRIARVECEVHFSFL